MDYPLENLGPERFQQLCQALLVREFPRVQCFPIAQPDGGRDAVSYFAHDSGGGFIVFQVKYARKPQAETEPHKWLVAVVEEEMEKVKGLIPRGATEYFIITNVSGTAHLDAGSIDKLNQAISTVLKLPSTCWWRDDLNRRLDDAWSLKWAYPELMTGPDFLRAIVETGLSEHRERRSGSIRAFLRAQYAMDEEVRFKQVELQNKLVDLFIDVPLTFRDARADRRQLHAFYSLIPNFDEEDDEPEFTWHNPAQEGVGAATMLLSPAIQSALPRIVIEGAPGQGKSTIAQYVCQVHRMRLLLEAEALSSVSQEHRTAPVRLPLKVDLRDLAAWMARRDPFNVDDPTTPPRGWHKSLESFLAALVSHQSGGTQFNTDDLLAVFRISSVLLVFDGLDEVADIARRSEIVEEIVKGVQRLEENAASLQVVVTSRPAAFANSPGMPHEKYPHLHLVSLTQELIMLYAERWLRARHFDGKQSAEFRRILRDKLEQPHLRDLARNPMQLAILLSLVLTRGASLPDKRTALYDYYIDLFVSREAEKSLIVRNHRELLIDIHRYLAWLLHSEAETTDARASIPQERLQQVVADYLSKEGHDQSLARDLFTGMVERVVALVSRVEGTFEFEVQPLREYFAACHLYYTAPQSSPGKERPGSKPDRFDAIARNFYWLNVTRFYAGCYSKGELPSLVERLEELASANGFRTTSYPQMLAITLLSDWVFAQNPRSVQQVVDLATKVPGFRFLTASLNSRNRSAASISPLPAKCGRDETIRRCFGILLNEPPDDFADEVLRFLRTTVDSVNDLLPPWIDIISKQKGERERTLWLEHGRRLDVLSKIDIADIRRIIPEALPKRPILRVLFRAGRMDYLQQSEALFDYVLAAILDGGLTNAGSPKDALESPLQALTGALDPQRYALSFRNRQPVPLTVVLDRYNRPGSLRWNPRLTTSTESYTNHGACIELARTADQESKRPCVEWATEIDPWNRLIEAGRRLWGEQRVFFSLANISGGIRSSAEKCTDCPDLLDTSRPLARRARYARLRSGSCSWWKSQLELAESTQDKELVCLIALTWATSTTLVAILDEMGSALSALPSPEWIRLFYAVQRAASTVRREDERDLVDPRHLPPTMSVRSAVILTTRSDPRTAHAIYEKHLASSINEDPIVPELALGDALDPSRVGTEAWAPNLDLVRQCYKLGEDIPPWGFLGRANRATSADIPLRIATQVAAHPDQYPGFLVALAEERCRADVATKIVPVAKAAETDRWFAPT
ncbi:MAG TPA: hypothetical protein VLY23_19820 [Candidatus Acidoferrum sp.]|nr:hypothetical protein [Candidatus Acidoferrum sp.]